MAANKDPGGGSKPSTHCGDFSKISPALLSAVGDLKIFVLWKWAKRAGKWTKPLLRADDPSRNASTTDPATWSTLKQAVASYQAHAAKVAGIGLVLTSTSVAGIDLDHCRSEDGTVDAWARPILKRAMTEMAYVEVSVSGTGFHILGLADRMPVTKVLAVKDAHPDAKVEVYFKPAGRYLTLSAVQHGRTGLALPDISDFVGDVIAQVSGERMIEDVLPKGAPKGERSEEFNRVVWSLAAEGMSAEQIEVELEKHPSGIASKYAGRLEKEVKRSYDKWLEKRGVSLEDFYAYMPTHRYIFTPTRDLWPATSVDDRILPVQIFDKNGKKVLNTRGKELKIPASRWLSQNRPVEQMTWVPGEPLVIKDKVVVQDGWEIAPGCSSFNLYRPPTIIRGVAPRADRWVNLVKLIYPDEWEHITKWFAHRVQRPGEKINHALLLGGSPGIGKDTILESVRIAIGPGNLREIGPHHIFEAFNDYVKCVILRISEARDLGERNNLRFQFYERLKTLTTTPPNGIRCNEKNIKAYDVRNCCSIVITTNRKDSLYVPPDDRRVYVAWSSLTNEDFAPDFWIKYYNWMEREGGNSHVLAYLSDLDLSSFNAKAPPEKTTVFWEIVEANTTPEDSDFADVLQKLGWPKAVSTWEIQQESTTGELFAFFDDSSNRKQIPHRMANCDYVPVRNMAAKDGRWVANQKDKLDKTKTIVRRHRIYAKKELTLRERIEAAHICINRIEGKIVQFPGNVGVEKDRKDQDKEG